MSGCCPIAYSPSSRSLLASHLFTASSVLLQTSPGPWNPAPASISSPTLLLPTPAIVFIAVGIYLVLLGLVLLTRHCLLVRSLGWKKGEGRGGGTWSLVSPSPASLYLGTPCNLVRASALSLGAGESSSVTPVNPCLAPLQKLKWRVVPSLLTSPDPESCHLLGPGLLHRLQLPLQETRCLRDTRLLLELCRSL